MSKHKRKQREAELSSSSDDELPFYSPGASPAAQPGRAPAGGAPAPAAAPHVPLPQQQKKPRVQVQKRQLPAAPVRVELTILPSPARQPMRGKRAPPLSPVAAAAAAVVAPPQSRARVGAAGVGQHRANGAAPSRSVKVTAVMPAVAAAAAARPAAAAPRPATAAPAARPVPAAAAAARPAAAAASRSAAGGLVRQAAPPAASLVAPSAAVPAAPPAASLIALSAAGPAAAAAAAAAAAGIVKRKARKSKRKTLTAKGKRAAVLAVLADVELHRAAGGGGGEQPPAANQQQQQRQQWAEATPSRQAAVAPVPALPPPPQQQQLVAQQEQEQQEQDSAATANLGKSWSKADISTLARLAEDRAFLLATLPHHPPTGELDWELISRHFGRYSRGGVAVRQQYYSVLRLVKAARHEGRKGDSYVDLVRATLAALPDGRGTIFEIQALLKRDHCSSLDKYRVRGVLRWKAAVGEVLREQGALFEQVGKTATGKIIWKLRHA